MDTTVNGGDDRLVRDFLSRVCIAVAGSILLGAPLHAAAATPTEYQLKAVFLYNFAQFVEWPATAFSSPQAPLVICVLGEDPFGADLDRVTAGETAQNHPIAVARHQDVSTVDTCHILFVSESEAPRFPQILEAVKGRNILTVSDAEGFAESGGMIRFVTLQKRVRLRVSVEPASAAQLAISSKLLRLAEIVPPGGS